MVNVLSWSLAAGCAASGIALADVLRLRFRARRAVGIPIYAVRGRIVPRAALAGLAALALGLACSWPMPLSALGASLAVLGLGLAAASPAAEERVCGRDGLRAGWEALRYEELAEWRLTGDHLRFRGSAEWSAVDLPRPLQREVRALLEDRCASAESRFRS